MAVYEFKIDDTDEVVELFMSFSEHEKRVKDGKLKLDDGRLATTYWGNSVTKTYPSCYPMESDAAGVHPAQVRDQVEHLRKMGCGFVEHSKNGNPIFQDKAQRKQVCEALGLFDRRASYGDPQPKHRTKNCKSFIR